MAESINRKELLEGPIIRSLLKLAIPLVLANILLSGYQLIDGFWVGRLDGDAVAAVSESWALHWAFGHLRVLVF